MPLFRKKDPVPPPATAAAPPPSVPVLKCRGDERALEFEEQLARGRWQEFHDFLQETDNWGIRSFYVSELSTIPGRPQWLDEWVAARPQSALPLLFRGVHSKNWAWEARGGGRAKTVKKDAWPLFHARLVEADRDLAAAAALDELDPTAWAASVIVGMGLSLGQPELRRRFDEAHRRDPLNGAACVNMIQATSRKWGGSNEAMLEFARWAAGQAPDGHSVHKVVALAHIEMWLDAPKGEPQRGYFRSPAVMQEVMDVARRSILSPNYAPEGIALSWADRNVFAFCFRLMREYAAQLEQMRLIGPHVVAFPWVYQGTAGQKYEEHRQHAFKQLYAVAAPPWEAFLASAGWAQPPAAGADQAQ
ncbi:MAG TPA: DUF4034 domain-containing protein [Trebonia sp.]|nr:DUF4034 domain-containing protein [Trebonia sp.]